MNDLDRVNRDKDFAEVMGFKLKPTVYAMGTPVNQVGIDNYKASRTEYENLPLAEEVAESISQKIASEHRLDIEQELIDTTYDVENILYSSEGNGYIPSSWALKQLIERSRPQTGIHHEAAIKAASYASDPQCPDWMRKDIVDHYTNHALKNKKAISVVLRTRDPIYLSSENEDFKQLFAVVSNRYNRDCDADVIAKMMARKVEESGVPAKAEAMYDGQRFRMTIWYHSDIKTPVAGELFKAGVIIESADDGSRGISITPTVWRNLCLNFIILDKATQTVKLTHLRSDLYNDISEAINSAVAKVSGFGEIWTKANKDEIVDSIYDNYDATHVFEALVKQGHVKITGCDKQEMVDRLCAAWVKEPGYTKAAIVNAITRAAHENSWRSPWATTELEEQAGELLYNKLVLKLE